MRRGQAVRRAMPIVFSPGFESEGNSSIHDFSILNPHRSPYLSHNRDRQLQLLVGWHISSSVETRQVYQAGAMFNSFIPNQRRLLGIAPVHTAMPINT